jgi:hypothetical protein
VDDRAGDEALTPDGQFSPRWRSAARRRRAPPGGGDSRRLPGNRRSQVGCRADRRRGGHGWAATVGGRGYMEAIVTAAVAAGAVGGSWQACPGDGGRARALAVVGTEPARQRWSTPGVTTGGAVRRRGVAPAVTPRGRPGSATTGIPAPADGDRSSAPAAAVQARTDQPQ